MPSLRALAAAVLAAAAAAAAPSPPDAAAEDGLRAKYFQEPGPGFQLAHYDSRFFGGEVPYAAHRDVLAGLIRSYLAVMDGLGVETWLAHGTLLGWWWSGRAMPWDYDLDVQVSNATMGWLAARLNGSRHAVAGSTYLLDVNPHHGELTRGDGLNVIDARWIDTANGMFVDITALRQRDARDAGVWSCKNEHRYAARDLWPLRPTRFEGAAARVPYAFERILVDEYGPQSLVVEEFEGHRWDRRVKEWVPMTPDERQKSLDAARARKRLAERNQQQQERQDGAYHQQA